jgi:hypothetical protein
MSLETHNRVSKFVAGLLERDLSYDERIEIANFIKAESIESGNTDEHQSVIYIANMAKKYYEMLLRHVRYEIKTIFEYTAIAQPKRAYLCLDSRYAIFNETRTALTWCVSESLIDANNIANLLGGVRNVNWIRIQSFVIRKFDSDTQRATVLIEELSSQSFIMHSGRKFHFMGLISDLQSSVVPYGQLAATDSFVPDMGMFGRYELTFDNRCNEGYYRFNKPISMLNNITVSVGNPDQLVVIPKYEFTNGTVTDLTTSTITIELYEPHNLTTNNGPSPYYLGTWYSVFIDDFSTNEASNAAYDNYVNTKEHTTVAIVSETRLTITFRDQKVGKLMNSEPVAYQTLTSVPLSQVSKVKLRVNYSRVIINLEMEYDG